MIESMLDFIYTTVGGQFWTIWLFSMALPFIVRIMAVVVCVPFNLLCGLLLETIPYRIIRYMKG